MMMMMMMFWPIEYKIVKFWVYFETVKFTWDQSSNQTGFFFKLQ